MALLLGSLVLMIGHALYYLKYERARVRMFADVRSDLMQRIMYNTLGQGESVITGRDYVLRLHVQPDAIYKRYWHVKAEADWRDAVASFYTGFYR